MNRRKAYQTVLPWGLCLLAFCASAGADFTTPARVLVQADPAIRYHVLGKEQEPVAFILGGGPGFSSWNLEPIQEHVAALGYEAVIMDMRGVGENAGAVEGALLDAWIEQIDTVRQAVADGPVTVIGHSWGALMALLYTRAYPERVGQLVLLNPVDPRTRSMRYVTTEIHERRLSESGAGWADAERWSNEIPEKVNGRLKTVKQIRRALPAYFHDYEQGRRYAAQFDADDYNLELNIEGWQAYERDPVRYETIRQWGIPIDFLGCREDLLMPYNLEAMREQIDFAHVDVLEGCVHFPWVEVPAAFNRALGRLLRGDDRRGSPLGPEQQPDQQPQDREQQYEDDPQDL